MMLKELHKLADFLPGRWVAAICTCGPIGYLGKAPGTNGSVLGILLYTAFFHPSGLLWQVLSGGILIVLAVLLCERGEKILQKRDPGEMILDEVVAVPLCFLGLKGFMLETGAVWACMLAGFLVFRFYDIVKPFGIRSLQRYPGGVGVVIDDVAAAIATNLTLLIFLFALSFGGWIG